MQKEVIMHKKAQAAMEFLMTYGWAILVVLIVLAALFYLGIFSPIIPSTCVVSAPFICQDIVIRENHVEVLLLAFNIQSGTVTEMIVNGQACSTVGNQLINDQVNRIVCSGINLNEGGKARVNFKLNYVSRTGGIPHDIEGEGSGTVEGLGALGIFVEGASFNRGSGCGVYPVSDAPIVGSCDNNCGMVCSSDSYLEYDTSTESGKHYVVMLKIADYLHNCQDKLQISVYANGNPIGTWQGNGINNWAYPSFSFTATGATTIRVREDNDACCGCSGTCNPLCSPLAGDLNMYLDDLTLV